MVLKNSIRDMNVRRILEISRKLVMLDNADNIMIMGETKEKVAQTTTSVLKLVNKCVYVLRLKK